MTVTMQLLGETKEWHYFLFQRCGSGHRDSQKCPFISVPNLGFLETTLQRQLNPVMLPSAFTLPCQGGKDQWCLCLEMRWPFPLRSWHYQCPHMVTSAWAASSSLPPQHLPAPVTTAYGGAGRGADCTWTPGSALAASSLMDEIQNVNPNPQSHQCTGVNQLCSCLGLDTPLWHAWKMFASPPQQISWERENKLLCLQTWLQLNRIAFREPWKSWLISKCYWNQESHFFPHEFWVMPQHGSTFSLCHKVKFLTKAF